MGLYDRHYIRQENPQGPGRVRAGGGPANWSVNTWIIVICAAVFVLDTFLPTRLVPISAPDLFTGVDSVPRSAVLVGDPQPYQYSRTTQGGELIEVRGFGQAILATDGGEHIGWQPVTRMHFLESFLHFSTQKGFFEVQFWRLIGFQFLHSHGTLAHLLFNMIGLFFFGPMVERYLGAKRYLAFYLLCGIFGALVYVALNVSGMIATSFFGLTDAVPGLLFNDMYTPLIGASAGVFGVLMAGAYLAPNATVLLFFILPMRLVTLAYALVAIALLTVIFGGNNAGGEAGHLGGAIAGFYFIRHPRHLQGFFNILGYADPTSHHYRKNQDRKKRAKIGGGSRPDRAKVDRILDKINAQGLHSLTDREKQILRESSEK